MLLEEGETSMTKTTALLALVSITGACQFEASIQPKGPRLEVQRFGTLAGDGGNIVPTRSYGSRHGPRRARDFWASSIIAPLMPGPRTGALPAVTGTEGEGPDVLVDGVAITSDGTATVAFDLNTHMEAWRATGANALAPAFVTTDGDTLCGLTPTVPHSIVCLDFATGARISGLTAGIPGIGSWDYGLEIVDGVLYVDAYGEILAMDIATGAELFRATGLARVRPFVIAGDDFLMPSAACPSSAAHCILVVDPRTGALRTSYDADQPAYLFQLGAEALFAVGAAPQTVVAYDPSSDAFRALPGWDAIFTSLTGDQLRAVTDVLPDGSVYLSSLNNVFTTLCRFDTATRAASWCVELGNSAREYRIHPNGVLVAGSLGQRDRVIEVPGATLTPTSFALYFEGWAFVNGAYHATQ